MHQNDPKWWQMEGSNETHSQYLHSIRTYALIIILLAVGSALLGIMSPDWHEDMERHTTHLHRYIPTPFASPDQTWVGLSNQLIMVIYRGMSTNIL